VSVVLSVLGTLLFRKRFGHEHLSRHNDVAGFIFAVIGVIYAVLIAFVVLVVWEEYQEANHTLENESNTISAMLVLSDGFNQDYSKEFKNKLKIYLDDIINKDWKIMTSNSSLINMNTKPSDKSYIALREIIYKYQEKTVNEKILIDKLINNIETLASARRMRFYSTKNVVPGFLWFVMIFGAVLVIAFSMLFSSVNLWAQIVMISILSMSISLVLLLIFEMNHPYIGLVKLEPDCYKAILETIWY
jgi:hypothetical protein